MEIIVKKSTDLSEKEFARISAIFEEIFGKRRSVSTLRRQYERNPLGFAWISMIYDNEEIQGINVYLPCFYIVSGKRLLFANSIDTMVRKPYRDFFSYNDMLKTAYKVLKKEGVTFVYGYPNDNAYPVVIKSKLFKDIGKMRTYCLPLRIGGIKSKFRFLNPLSYVFCKAYVFYGNMMNRSIAPDYKIHKEEETYNQTRYKRGDADYGIERLKNGATLFYKIKNHEGIRTAFIIDITDKSPASFNLAVRYLISNHKKDFDLILYPGLLNSWSTGLIPLPVKYEPKNFYFVGKILDKDALGDEVWDIRNWDTNLSNYDLI